MAEFQSAKNKAWDTGSSITFCKLVDPKNT